MFFLVMFYSTPKKPFLQTAKDAFRAPNPSDEIVHGVSVEFIMRFYADIGKIFVVFVTCDKAKQEISK